VNSYLDQDFSGILQNKADVLIRYSTDRVISEYSRNAMLNFEYIIYHMPIPLCYI
jgi:hypothetical protein